MNTPETQSEKDDNSKPSLAGCLLLVLCLAVIVFVALEVVTWRDPAVTLSVELKAAIPILAGALCLRYWRSDSANPGPPHPGEAAEGTIRLPGRPGHARQGQAVFGLMGELVSFQFAGRSQRSSSAKAIKDI